MDLLDPFSLSVLRVHYQFMLTKLVGSFQYDMMRYYIIAQFLFHFFQYDILKKPRMDIHD